MCERERVWEKERDRMSGCTRKRYARDCTLPERESVCVRERERERVSVCERDTEREGEIVRARLREEGRERERGRVCERKCVCVCVFVCLCV